MSKQEIIERARGFINAGALILDTETTGLGAEDEIVEIALVDANETLQFSSLVQPSKPIPPESSAIHGITDELVAWARRWPWVWQSVKDIIGARPLLAYNANFDNRMIWQTGKIYGLDGPSNWHCLMVDWQEFYGLARWAKLDDVCYDIDIPVGGHRALGDAKAAREVLRWLAKQEA
jgi:DNA polymerase-3 subunit epsilon